MFTIVYASSFEYICDNILSYVFQEVFHYFHNENFVWIAQEFLDCMYVALFFRYTHKSKSGGVKTGECAGQSTSLFF